jgi:hypothetical protein
MGRAGVCLLLGAFRILAMVLVGSVVISAAEPAGPLAIERTPPVVVYRTFDPRSPPADMPPLTPPEIGLCVSQFGCEVRLWTSAPAGRPVATVVDAVEITTRLQVTIWTRENAPAAEREHEEGHRTISDYYYSHAETTARRLAEAIVGQRVLELLRGNDPALPAGAAGVEAAIRLVRDRLVEEFLARTHWRAAFAREAFDDITDHGRKAIAVSTAVSQAIAEEQGARATAPR